jgi:hypothetical protein
MSEPKKTLKVQEYLRGGGKLEELTEKYSIKTRRHSTFPNLVCLKYDQISSDFTQEIVRECRGLVLDEADDWRVVSMAFSKFMNHGQAGADDIDWSTARVQEKVDGSLCAMYFYRNGWHVATTGTPDASGDVNGFGTTFAKLFWGVYPPREPPVEAEGYTFVFELTGPMNRIVVPHAKTSLTLLACRRLCDLQEIPPDEAVCLLNIDGLVPVVRSFPLGNVEDIIASFADISPLSQEGYVVVDGAYRRIKVKHPGYVALHHAKDGLSQKAIVDIARSGEVPEVMTAFPELAPMLDDARDRLAALVGQVEADYARLAHHAEQKAFAAEALKTKCSAALFQIRAKKTPGAAHFFAGMQLDRLMDLLGYGSDRVEAAAE